MKVVSMGFYFGKKTYLKNGWNLIDFIVVISSILGFLPNKVNIGTIRVIRIFRPLKAVSQLKCIKLIFKLLII